MESQLFKMTLKVEENKNYCGRQTEERGLGPLVKKVTWLE